MEAVMSYDVDIVAIIFVAVAGLIWGVRLEAKVLYLEDSMKNQWTKFDDMKLKIDKIAESLARLEGRLDTNNKGE